MYKKKLKRKGMTLIEVLVTLAIFAIVIQVSYSIFFAGNKSFEVSKNIGFAQQDVRLASDFINYELRYINQLVDDEDEFLDVEKYYSLEIKENEDGTYSLIKKEYGEGFDEEGNLLRSINGKWSKISISNFETGKIISTINQVEGEQEYSIDNFEVALENNRYLKSDIEISSADEKNKIIYYAFPSDITIASVEDIEDPEGPGDDIEEPGDEDEESEIPKWKNNIAYKKGSIVIYDGKKYKAAKDTSKVPTNNGHWSIIN